MAFSVTEIETSGIGTWPTRLGAATRLSLIWGLPDAPEGFLETARGGRI
jgi:hypothetical protein